MIESQDTTDFEHAEGAVHAYLEAAWNVIQEATGMSPDEITADFLGTVMQSIQQERWAIAAKGLPLDQNKSFEMLHRVYQRMQDNKQ
jgi:hypothetical protein